jgi:hypothetical protein
MHRPVLRPDADVWQRQIKPCCEPVHVVGIELGRSIERDGDRKGQRLLVAAGAEEVAEPECVV